MTTCIEALRPPVSAVAPLFYAVGERRFLAAGADITAAIAPVKRGYGARSLAELPPHRAVELAGLTLLFLEAEQTGHMLSHYFHLLEQILSVWPYVAERRQAVRRVVLATDGRALPDWRGPNAINEQLLGALFPTAEVITWPAFHALGGGLGARLYDRVVGRAPELVRLDEVLVSDRARTLTDPACHRINKMLAHFRDAFPPATWRTLVDAVLAGVEVAPEQQATLSVVHVLRQPPRCLTPAAEARLHAAIEAIDRVTLRPLDFARLSYAEQLAAAASADVLIGVHGNGMSHGFFLPTGAAMIELFPADGHALDYRVLAELRGLRYLGVHPEHGVVSRDDAERIGAYGRLRGEVDGFALEPIVAFIEQCRR